FTVIRWIAKQFTRIIPVKSTSRSSPTTQTGSTNSWPHWTPTAKPIQPPVLHSPPRRSDEHIAISSPWHPVLRSNSKEKSSTKKNALAAVERQGRFSFRDSRDQLKKGSRGTGCRLRGDTAPRASSQTCPTGAGNDPLTPASALRNDSSRLRPA